MYLLEFIFKSFWTFIGTVMLVGMLCKTIVLCISMITGNYNRYEKTEKDGKES